MHILNKLFKPKKTTDVVSFRAPARIRRQLEILQERWEETSLTRVIIKAIEEAYLREITTKPVPVEEMPSKETDPEHIDIQKLLEEQGYQLR